MNLQVKNAENEKFSRSTTIQSKFYSSSKENENRATKIASLLAVSEGRNFSFVNSTTTDSLSNVKTEQDSEKGLYAVFQLRTFCHGNGRPQDFFQRGSDFF